MMKIQCLLKQLPRELRFQVITKAFSQAQRVLLQKWMVDTGATPQGDSSFASSAVVVRIPSPGKGASCTVGEEEQAKKIAAGLRNQRGPAERERSVSGQCWNWSCENLQQMLWIAHSSWILGDPHLRKAESNGEQLPGLWRCVGGLLPRSACVLRCGARKSIEELELRFTVTQNMGIFIGRRQVKAPVVYCLDDDVKKLRYCMEAFRQRVKPCRRNCNVFDFSLPCELEELWQQFVGTVADIFHAIGANATSYLTRIHAWHAEADHVRARHLQLWERRWMAAHDKEQHRKKKCCKNNVKMAVNPLGVQDHEARQLNRLRKLLKRWQYLLRREAQRRENLRRKILHKHTQGAKGTTSTKRNKRNRTWLDDLRPWPKRQHVSVAAVGFRYYYCIWMYLKSLSQRVGWSPFDDMPIFAT